ncbi:MFS transporter [Mariniluteicoccus flavus]
MAEHRLADQQAAYRWVVLAVTFAVNATIQLIWVSYASVTLDAQRFFGVGTTAIGAFSMIFMAAFLPLSLPASWLIDRVGVRRAVGAAAAATAAGALLRGLAGDAYAAALLATLPPAIAQPVIMNAWTATVHPWFAPRHRTTAVSVVTLAGLIGTVVLVATPMLLETMTLGAIQLVHGAAALASAAAFLALMRDRPSGGPAYADDAEMHAARLGTAFRETLALTGRRPMPMLLVMTFVAYGTFNGVTTWVEPIVATAGLDAAGAGLFGALMLLGGLVGAVVVSAICDRTGRREPALVTCMALSALALVVVSVARTPVVELVGGVVLGFFLISCLPVAVEYRPRSPTPRHRRWPTAWCSCADRRRSCSCSPAVRSASRSGRSAPCCTRERRTSRSARWPGPCFVGAGRRRPGECRAAGRLDRDRTVPAARVRPRHRRRRSEGGVAQRDRRRHVRPPRRLLQDRPAPPRVGSDRGGRAHGLGGPPAVGA